MIRSLALATVKVGCCDSRMMPKVPIAISMAMDVTGAIHGARPREPRSISAAGLAKIATVRNVMPHRPISDAVCASASGSNSA